MVKTIPHNIISSIRVSFISISFLFNNIVRAINGTSDKTWAINYLFIGVDNCCCLNPIIATPHKMFGSILDLFDWEYLKVVIPKSFLRCFRFAHAYILSYIEVYATPPLDFLNNPPCLIKPHIHSLPALSSTFGYAIADRNHHQYHLVQQGQKYEYCIQPR